MTQDELDQYVISEAKRLINSTDEKIEELTHHIRQLEKDRERLRAVRKIYEQVLEEQK